MAVWLTYARKEPISADNADLDDRPLLAIDAAAAQPGRERVRSKRGDVERLAHGKSHSFVA